MEQGRCVALPLEIWERVFTFLHREEELLIIQSVCTAWTSLVNKLPPKLSWNPWFSKQHTAEAMLTFRHTPGSRFESREEILNFLHAMDQRPFDYLQSNPFINNTVIFNWRSVGEYHALHREAPSLALQHGSHVRKLLYFIHEFVPQSMESIPEILRSMKNLRSLTIYSPASDYKLISSRFRFPELPPLKHFRELEILGMDNFFLLKQIVTFYGAQLRSLHWWDNKSVMVRQDWKTILGFCPNLVNFKILNAGFLEHRIRRGEDVSASKMPKGLKRFAYKTLSKEIRDCYGTEFNSVMGVAGLFSEKLEMMSLYLKVPDRVDVALNDTPEFPELKEFAIPFSFVHHPILPQVVVKFPHLKRLTFLDTKDSFQNRPVEVEELSQLFASLWPQLPAAVEVISIRSRQFNEELQRHFPVWHSCSKSLR